MADELGISLYQRFSSEEACEFLKCNSSELEAIIEDEDIECIFVTKNNIQFFGFQLIDYLLCQSTSIIKNHSTEPDRIIRANEVESMTCLSRTMIWRYEKDNKFPKRRKLGNISVGWLLNEIQDWIQSR